MPKTRIAVILLSVVFLFSCTHMIKPENPKEVYLVALTEYNNLLELYAGNAAALTNDKTKAEINGAFLLASDALDAWHLAITMGNDPYEQQIKVKAIMSKLIEMVFKVMGDKL